eukprot:CAMPEP_0176415618 /NCGR_PEP_ID=MMETSP0127-20121128/5904_1 /TAXON_ID=938130 /ORGANISM="Platyophrya macrostoma, Strain WH" /LENGTH=281 /DNA_ID=CAMNT_0017795629 /DNA_START=87 /DNA_END=932 /DNA_ORIENTATION=+
MRSIKNAAYFMIPLGLGTYSYASYVHSHRKRRTYLDNSHFSDEFTTFIKQNNLVVPEFFHKLRHDNNINSLFFKSILKNVGALDQFTVYMDEVLNKVVNKDVKVTEQERKKLFENSKIYCMFVANQTTENEENLLPAGFTATLFDNMGGALAFLSCGSKPVATSSMAVNYHKPIRAGDEYLTEISTQKVDGKSVKVQGIIKDREGNVYADADLIFIQVDWKNVVFSNMFKNIVEKVRNKTEKGLSELESTHIYMNVPDILLDLQADPRRKLRFGERYAKFC